MDGGVVKLNTLADTNGAGTQNDDLLLIGQAGSILAGVGGVEVGDVAPLISNILHEITILRL